MWLERNQENGAGEPQKGPETCPGPALGTCKAKRSRRTDLESLVRGDELRGEGAAPRGQQEVDGR